MRVSSELGWYHEFRPSSLSGEGFSLRGCHEEILRYNTNLLRQ